MLSLPAEKEALNYFQPLKNILLNIDSGLITKLPQWLKMPSKLNN